MEPVRYEPGEAIRWLTTGAENLRDSASKQSKDVFGRHGERSFTKDVRQMIGAAVDLGKGAIAELAHKQLEAEEYVIYEDRFEIVSGNNIRPIKFSEVIAIRMKGNNAVFVLEKGTFEMKPFAYLVAGKVKVPIGWCRNGIEVPYGLILDELSARSGRTVQME